MDFTARRILTRWATRVEREGVDGRGHVRELECACMAPAIQWFGRLTATLT
jgi:hypothetical protein